MMERHDAVSAGLAGQQQQQPGRQTEIYASSRDSTESQQQASVQHLTLQQQCDFGGHHPQLQQHHHYYQHQSCYQKWQHDLSQTLCNDQHQQHESQPRTLDRQHSPSLSSSHPPSQRPTTSSSNSLVPREHSSPNRSVEQLTCKFSKHNLRNPSDSPLLPSSTSLHSSSTTAPTSGRSEMPAVLSSYPLSHPFPAPWRRDYHPHSMVPSPNNYPWLTGPIPSIVEPKPSKPQPVEVDSIPIEPEPIRPQPIEPDTSSQQPEPIEVDEEYMRNPNAAEEDEARLRAELPRLLAKRPSAYLRRLNPRLNPKVEKMIATGDQCNVRGESSAAGPGGQQRQQHTAPNPITASSDNLADEALSNSHIYLTYLESDPDCAMPDPLTAQEDEGVSDISLGNVLNISQVSRAISLRVAYQPGGIRRYTVDGYTIEYKLAQDAALRCQNVVLNRPRMRKKTKIRVQREGRDRDRDRDRERSRVSSNATIPPREHNRNQGSGLTPMEGVTATSFTSGDPSVTSIVMEGMSPSFSQNQSHG